MYVSDVLKPKNNNLTLIRILLAIMVLYGHSFVLLKKSMENTEFFVKYFSITYSGSIAVSLFFFISGMLVTKSYITKNSPQSFIISRAFRILPALLISAILLAIFIGPLLTKFSLTEYFLDKEWYRFIYKNILMSTRAFLPGVYDNLPFGANVAISWWTIRYEVAFYIFILCFGMLGILQNKYLASLICTLIIILVITDSKFIMSALGKAQYQYYLAFYFSVGVLFNIWGQYIKINVKTLCAVMIITYLCRNTTIYPALFSISSLYLVLWLAINPLFKKIKVKHDTSYGIYIYGGFIQQFLIYCFPNMNNYWNTIFSILICIPIGLLSAIYIEEPFMEYGRKLSKNYFSV